MNKKDIYEVYIETFFSSAHRLEKYKGKCEKLHGHNWKVGVCVRSRKLNKEGMVIDFKLLKETADRILHKIDHCYLNNIPYFKINQPTAENICKFLHNKILKELSKINKYIHSLKIIVWETPIQYACYEK